MKDRSALKLHTFFMSFSRIGLHKLDKDEITVGKCSLKDQIASHSAFVRDMVRRFGGMPERGELRRVWIKHIHISPTDARPAERRKLDLVVSAQLGDSIPHCTNMAGGIQL